MNDSNNFKHSRRRNVASGNDRVNCMKCLYFYITWDTNNPGGCKYFGFKSKTAPSYYVKISSGRECSAYTKK